MNTKLQDLYNFKVITVDNSESWETTIKSFKNADSYYTLGYVKSFMAHGDGIPVLLYYENNGLRAMNVVMLRCVNDISYLELDGDKKFYDISTPYGYGGFILEGETVESAIRLLEDDYSKFCQNNDIVCEFVRFHPVLKNHEEVDNLYEVIHIGSTVLMNLENEEQIWSDITSKNRNIIRKAIKNNVTIHQGNSRELIEKFMCMYNKTMDRDNARPYYYFGREFYDTLFSESEDDEVTIFYAEYEGEIISMSIIMKRNGQVHYHLSASEFEFRSLGATNLLLWEVAKWGCSRGCKTFHLGGGIGGDIHDTLFKFKKSFNRNSENQFYIGRKIFDDNAYEFLVKTAQEKVTLDSNFFPVYRSGRI